MSFSKPAVKSEVSNENKQFQEKQDVECPQEIRRHPSTRHAEKHGKYHDEMRDRALGHQSCSRSEAPIMSSTGSN